jgi:aminodeoxyfutalosine synthase
VSARAAAGHERLLARCERAGIGDLARKVLARERLSPADGLRLYRADLFAVGDLANLVRERLHGDLAYFNVNQHVNYTNICNKLCRFCAFQRLPNQPGARSRSSAPSP